MHFYLRETSNEILKNITLTEIVCLSQLIKFPQNKRFFKFFSIIKDKKDILSDEVMFTYIYMYIYYIAYTTVAVI